MEMNYYQEAAEKTAVFEKEIDELLEQLKGPTEVLWMIKRRLMSSYILLGLLGEAGELANKFKKVIRGDMKGIQEWNDGFAKEQGDVLWYWSMLNRSEEYKNADIAQMNLNKLADRAARNQIKGSGDDERNACKNFYNLEELKRALEKANLQIVSAWYGQPAKGVIEDVSDFFPGSCYSTYIVEKDKK